jgi:hypothetical protein
MLKVKGAMSSTDLTGHAINMPVGTVYDFDWVTIQAPTRLASIRAGCGESGKLSPFHYFDCECRHTPKARPNREPAG